MFFAAAFLGLFAVVLLAMAVMVYNSLVHLRNQVDRAWANIDVILKQRHDELPNLISVCEQFAQYERATIDRLVEARKHYGAATTLNQKVAAAAEVSGALRGILAIGEAYPELKSSDQFVHLQTRISGLESQIADRRELFNETVTNYNTRIRQIPDVFFAGMLGYQNLELFKVAEEERRAPSVKMKLPAA
jgi:LemA protein